MKKNFKRIIGALCLIFVLALALLPCLQIFAAESDSTVYISELTPTVATSGWRDVRFDVDLSGNTINIGGKEFKHGVSVHAASVVEYDIFGMEYEHFCAYIGITRAESNGTPEKSSVVFEVLADGVSLYKSAVKRYDDAPEKIELDLPYYTKKLTLKVTNAGDGGNGDHASWADACLKKGEYKDGDLKKVTLSCPKTELALGDETKLSLLAESYGGEKIDLSSLDIEYYTESPQMIKVDADGNIKILSGGVGVVCAKVTQKGDNGEIVRIATLTLTSNVSSENRLDTHISSPSGNLEVKLYTDELGCIYYTVSEGGAQLLGESLVGLSTRECDLDSGFVLISSEASVIDETYENLSGKTSSARNHASRLLSRFEKGDYIFILEFRAYDDGFAYRYTVECKDEAVKSIVIDDETGYFSIPSGAKAFYQKIKNMNGAFNYEENYEESAASDITDNNVALPLLFSEDDEHWMLLSEAELYGDGYVGSSLYGESEGRLGLAFAPNTKDGTTVKTALSFTSPWRCGIAGGLDDIVESNLIENISSRREDGDFSWVKPGVTSWLWLEEGSSIHSNKRRIQEYIDLSAEMGWEYVLLDSGWQPDAPWGLYEWFPELVKYAEERGVGILVWVHYTKLDTPEEREVLKKWAELGIKGVKVDWMDSESQSMISFYRAVYEECEKNKLLVNPHGANKPTGERQYWPHVINREAVRGEEYQSYLASDLATWAFTRGVLGPMDVTPRVLPGKDSSTSAAAQLAMTVHFESGMPCMSSTPETYREAIGSAFLKDLPSVWDEIQFVDGYPGDYSVIARRSGESWYLSGLTNGVRKLNVSYDFLEEGVKYKAYIFADGASNGKLDVSEAIVTSLDSVDIRMRVSGGFAIKLVKAGSEDDVDLGLPEATEKSTKPPKKTEEVSETETEDKASATEEQKEKGCNSQIFIPVIALCTLSVATMVLKKKKEQ